MQLLPPAEPPFPHAPPAPRGRPEPPGSGRRQANQLGAAGPHPPEDESRPLLARGPPPGLRTTYVVATPRRTPAARPPPAAASNWHVLAPSGGSESSGCCSPLWLAEGSVLASRPHAAVEALLAGSSAGAHWLGSSMGVAAGRAGGSALVAAHLAVQLQDDPAVRGRTARDAYRQGFAAFYLLGKAPFALATVPLDYLHRSWQRRHGQTGGPPVPLHLSGDGPGEHAHRRRQRATFYL